MLLYTELKSVSQKDRCFKAHLNMQEHYSEVAHNFRKRSMSLNKNDHSSHWFRTPENLEAVNVAMIRSPGKSTQRASQQLLIVRTSIHSMLNMDLHLFPCKIQSVQILSNRTKKYQLLFAQLTQNLEILHNMQFTHE